MRTKILCNLIAIALLASFSTPTQAQIFEPKIDKLPGRLQIPDLSREQQTFSPFQRDERTANDKNSRFKPHDGTRYLKHQELDLNVAGLSTIPFWSDTFDYHGLRYTYKMVGTDPKRGSATTVIPVEIIPIRWVFSNGMVVDASTDIIDGQTPVQGILNSPIFQDYDFTSGGTHVGNTQYGDAFQRANFWNSVSTRSPNYHVRLAPTVLPTQTVVVPADKATFYTNPDTGYVLPEIDETFIGHLDYELHSSLGISPQSLPITLWGSVGTTGFALGYHGSYQVGNAIQSYIAGSYLPQAALGFIEDTSILSHEIIEWMDDPLNDNYSAGWENPFYVIDNPPPARARCDSYFEAQDLLETADPFETLGPVTYTPVDLNGFTYHMAEGAFIDFFTRNPRSRSVNGQYSFFEIIRPYGLDTPPSSDCLSSLHTDNQFFTVPGSVFTYAYGMNNTGSVVGHYFDTAGKRHGFKWDGTRYLTIDFPGALGTSATDINDSGTVIGFYFGNDGLPHGFSFRNSRFISIDFPGSSDTVPEKINSGGTIVGMFDVTQPITRGFFLDNKGYQPVDTPFGTQSEAAAINDQGTIAGNSWTDPLGPVYGFLGNKKSFSRFSFPDQTAALLTSINSYGDLGGLYPDSGPFQTGGFVRLLGYPYATFPLSYETVVSDINDNREILGLGYNINTSRFQPFIGRPALAGN